MSGVTQLQGADVAIKELASALNVDVEVLSRVNSEFLGSLKRFYKNVKDLKRENLELNGAIDTIKTHSNVQITTLREEIDRLTKTNSLSNHNDKLGHNELDVDGISEIIHADELKKQVRELERNCLMLNNENTKLHEAMEKLTANIRVKENDNEKLREEKRELASNLFQVESKLRCSDTNFANLQLELSRKYKEIEVADEHRNLLEQELTARTRDLMKLKSEEQSRRMNVDSMVSSLSDENRLLKTDNELLREKNEQLSNDLQEKAISIREMSNSLIATRESFSREMGLKKVVTSLLEEQVRSLQGEFHGDNGEDFERNRLINDLATTKSNLEATQKEVLALQSLLDECTHGAELTTPETLDEEHEDSCTGDSCKERKRYIFELRKYAVSEKQQKMHLQNELNSIVHELSEKLPEVEFFKERAEALEDKLTSSTNLLNQVYHEKEEVEAEFECFKKKQNESKENIRALRTQRTDLAQQVQYLLLVLSHQYEAHNLLSHDELMFIRRLVRGDNKDKLSASQEIISERMVKFESVVELQKRNMELLRATRYLSEQLELSGYESSTEKKDKLFEVRGIRGDSTKTLEEHVGSLEKKVKLLSQERDSYRLLLGLKDGENAVESNPLLEKDALIKKLREELSKSRQESQKTIDSLSNLAERRHRELQQLRTNDSKLEASVKYSENRLKLLEERSSSLLSEKEEYKSKLSQSQETLESKSKENTRLLYQLQEAKINLQTLKKRCDELEREKSLLNQENWSAKRDLSIVREEKDNLMISKMSLQNKIKDMSENATKTADKFSEKIHSYEAKINELNVTIVSKDQEIQNLESNHSKEVAWYRDKIGELVKSLESPPTTGKWGLLDGEFINSVLVDSNKSRSISLEQSHAMESIEFVQMDQDLKNAKLEADNYKNMFEKSEETYKELCRNFDGIETELQKHIETLSKENMELQNSLEEVRRDAEVTKHNLEERTQTLSEANKVLMERVTRLSDLEKETRSVNLDLKDKIEKLTSELTQERARHKKLMSYPPTTDIESDSTYDSLKSENESYKTKILELNNKVSCLDSVTKERAEMEMELEEARSQIENLTSQNNLLFERLGIFDPNGDPLPSLVSEKDELDGNLITSLKQERDNLRMKLSSMTKKLHTTNLSYLAANNELRKYVSGKEVSRDYKPNNSHTLSEYNKILDEVSRLNVMKQSLQASQAEIEHLKKDNQELHELLNEQSKELNPLKARNKTLEGDSLEKDRIISVYKNDNSRWKEEVSSINRKLQVVTEEKNRLRTELSSLSSTVDEKTRENIELEDKFIRLKKQAHEKLDESKAHSLELTTELDKAKREVESLRKILDEKDIALKHLKHHQEGNGVVEKTVSELNSELNVALEKLKDAEKKLAENVASSEAESQRLSLEIDSLKAKLSALQSSKSHMGDLPNSETAQLSESQVKFDKKITNVMDQKKGNLSGKHKTNTESNNITPGTITPGELELLKKKWEEETVKRIEDAKENLKRHIRLPTEEKIKRIVDKRKADLESKFDQRVEERANLLMLSKQTQSSPDVLRDEIKKQVESSLRREFEESKKRAFEEGRQQAAMKIKLLEKRLLRQEGSSVKAQRPIDKPISLGGSEVPKSKFGLSKIDVDSPRVMFQPKNVADSTADAKVRKLDSSTTPNAGQGLPSSTNPFTAQIGGKSQAFSQGVTRPIDQTSSSLATIAPDSTGANSAFARTPFSKAEVDLASPFKPAGFNFRLPANLAKTNESAAHQSSVFKRLTPINPGDEEQRDSKKVKTQESLDT